MSVEAYAPSAGASVTHTIWGQQGHLITSEIVLVV